VSCPAGDVAVRVDLGERTHPARSAASADVTTTAAAPSEIERHRPRGGKTIGTLPKGVPVPALPWTKWSDVGPLLLGAVREVVTDIDVTAAEVLKALDEELDDCGMHLAFVEPRDRLQDLVRRYGLNTTLDREHFYPSLDQTLDAIDNAAEDSPIPPDEGMPPP
jgi:hypothetical protein